MPESEIPQENPGSDSAAELVAHGPVASSPQPAAARAAKRSPARGKLVWGAVALLCTAAGAVGSILGAHAIAHTDAAKGRRSAQQSSAAISSTVKLSLRHEEDIAVGAATYFAGNANTSPKQFATWVKWARTLRRFPELDGLSLITLVHAGELAAFNARIRGQKLKPAPSAPATRAGRNATTLTASPTSGTSATPTAVPGSAASLTSDTSAASTSLAALSIAAKKPALPTLRIVPKSNHGYYCLAIANLVRAPAKSPRAGLDYCALTPGLLLTRNSGQSAYTTASVDGTRALAIDVPVYRGNVPPRSVFGRTAASVGWLRELLAPSVMLREALRGHPASAVSLAYHAGSANLTFASGAPLPASQSTTLALPNGWTVRSFAAVPGTSVLSDASALALLIVGCVLSAMLGLLIFVLGGGRTPLLVRVRVPQRAPDQAPVEQLHDPLTGLPNRPLMLDRAECMLARAGRQSGLLVGALFIDIDWFKDVNERLGQAAGDQILKIVAERLEGVVRAGDTVGRLGDDEFVVLVESAARGARLDSLARRVVEALHKPFDLDDFAPNFFLTASIGLAFGRYAAADDLLRDAQLALFAAKSAGKDRYTLFNANMRSVIEGRGVLEAELNTALAENQFFVLYEPIYDLGTGRVAGLEALVRWMHPKRGVVLPDDFMALAEESGLSVPIGRMALEEACSRAAAWIVAGHRVGITVEISPNQLNREGFITDVRRALQQSGIEPGMLTLAIAETTVMNDVNVAVEHLEELKHLGVRIAIDDFGGSGYAYHSDLRRLPLDFLKVDRGSLAASEDEDYRTWLLEAILIVGRDLSLTVIAKGIESYEQMSALQSMGCTMAQGALMGKPVAANAIENVLTGSIPTVRADALSPTRTHPQSI